MIRALVVAAVVVAVLLLTAWGLQRQLIYHPEDSAVPPVSTAVGTALPHARDVELHTADGLALGAWFVEAAEPGRDVAVLVANGNAGDRSGRASLARALADNGLDVLLFDYRGYGQNPGNPTEDGLALDVRAARAFLLAEAGVREDRLVYLGESLGTGVVTELAAEHPPAGMLLRSPYVDLASLGKVHYPFLPVRLLLRDRFPLAEHLAEVEAPVTVVYGAQDSIVPPDQSREVAERAPLLHDLVEIPGAGHNDPEMFDGALLVDAVLALADHVGGQP